jgi:SAM-dependent methyltransferase
MMFGYKDIFLYFQCSNCECLQIKDFPPNISKYYPDNYYSYDLISYQNKTVRFLHGLRDRYAVWGRGFLGKILNIKYPRLDLQSLRILSIKKDTSIIDIGCGAGALLYSLRELGLKNLLGVDPFIFKDIQYDNGLMIQKKEIFKIEGKWDIAMFHHALEHIHNPAETLKTVMRLLNPGGHCVIRIPLASSYAWKNFGINWVQLDAPRHFYLHSVNSMKILSDQAGLELWKIVFDSDSFQFWGSKQYSRDIPLRDKRSYQVNPGSSIFSKREISAFTKRAMELNKINQGDQAVLYLRKSFESTKK